MHRSQPTRQPEPVTESEQSYTDSEMPSEDQPQGFITIRELVAVTSHCHILSIALSDLFPSIFAEQIMQRLGEIKDLVELYQYELAETTDVNVRSACVALVLTSTKTCMFFERFSKKKKSFVDNTHGRELRSLLRDVFSAASDLIHSLCGNKEQSLAEPSDTETADSVQQEQDRAAAAMAALQKQKRRQQRSKKRPTVPSARQAWLRPRSTTASSDVSSSVLDSDAVSDTPRREPTAAVRREAERLCAMGDDAFFGTGRDIDYDEALEFYLLAADGGNLVAANQLGLMNQFGLGCEEDVVTAMQWYSQAALGGNLDAVFNLGCLHESYDELEHAARFYYDAARNGHAEAQVAFAFLLQSGRGLQADPEEAAKWYALAADNGHPKALNNLGMMFFAGHGVVQSDEEAVTLFHKSATEGYGVAQNNLAICYEEGVGVDTDLELAQWWYTEAVANEDINAMNNLGLLLLNFRQYDKAYELFTMASERGSPEGLFQLATMFLRGRWLKRDAAQAFAFYAAAAEMEHVGAIRQVASMLFSGVGTALDLEQAAQYYRVGAEMGDGECANNLGIMCEEGLGCTQDYRLARSMYQLAAATGNPHAIFNLGKMYEKGLGLVPSMNAAVRLYRKAASLGSEQAQEALRVLA